MLKVTMRNIKQLNNKGFGLLGILIVIVVLAAIGGTGVYIYHKQHKTRTTTAVTSSKAPSTTKSGGTSVPLATPAQNPYAGWKTCNDTADGVSFKYPQSWVLYGSTNTDPCANYTLANGNDGQGLSLQSPPHNNLAFLFWYTPALQMANLTKSNSASGPTAGDWQVVQSVTPITLNSGKSLSLVSYEDVGSSTKSSDSLISDMGLSNQKYVVGQTFHAFDGITSPKNTGYSVNIVVSLAIPKSQYVQSHSLADYQSQLAYKDLINIFKSVTY